MKKLLFITLISLFSISCSTPDTETIIIESPAPEDVTRVAQIGCSEPPFPGNRGATINGLPVSTSVIHYASPINVEKGDVIVMWGFQVALRINDELVVPMTLCWGPYAEQTQITYTVL